MKHACLLIVIGCLLCGCAAPLATKSGRPEISVTSASHDYVESRVVNFFVDKGYQPRVSDRYNLKFEKAGNFAESMFYGSGLQPTAYELIIVTILDNPGNEFRIIAKPFLVSNRGNTFESEVPLEGDADVAVQKMLEELRKSLAGY